MMNKQLILVLMVLVGVANASQRVVCPDIGDIQQATFGNEGIHKPYYLAHTRSYYSSTGCAVINGQTWGVQLQISDDQFNTTSPTYDDFQNYLQRLQYRAYPIAKYTKLDMYDPNIFQCAYMGNKVKALVYTLPNDSYWLSRYLTPCFNN